MKSKAIAIIPARGGSKRIPRKNIKNFCGKPMIAYSIEAAINSGCFEQVIVSTDDSEIADIAKQYGAEVPYLRSAKLSDDYATTADVMADAVSRLNNDEIEFICCIYATAPLLLSDDLIKGFSLLKDNEDADYTFSITEFAFPIQRALKLNNKAQISMFYPEYMSTRSQDLEEGWHDAGQFYWGTRNAWRDKKKIFGENSRGVKLPRIRVQDIDTFQDWEVAEFLYKNWMQV